ncbi:MAG: NAD-glutamate dehydrogenase [Desulfobacteraceae bacterium]|jgi:glutamate dehydrogenase
MSPRSRESNRDEKVLQNAAGVHDATLYHQIQKALNSHARNCTKNLEWLYDNMHPYFFITMKEEIGAIVNLASTLTSVVNNQKIILADQPEKLIAARLDVPGSLYDTLKTLQEREISYAEMLHSYGPMPLSDRALEVQRFEFQRRSHEEIASAAKVTVPSQIKKEVLAKLKGLYPNFDFKAFDAVLRLIWVNNESYIRISPSERIARLLWLYQQGMKHEGLYLDVEQKTDETPQMESRILFSVENPPEMGFLTQVSEVFQRLKIGVQRSYTLNISTGVSRYFLSTFYVRTLDDKLVERDSDLFRDLQTELYNTQILSTVRSTYKDFVANRIMTGEEASLTNAFVAFCHTTLAHSQPDRFDLETVKAAFHSDPDFTLKLVKLFKQRFDPRAEKRQPAYEKALDETFQAIESYNTGHKYLDEIRKTIFKTCILFINHTLKTNFFVPEKHALAFRLDPSYLGELGREVTAGLPQDTPFRITFFFGRYGMGYHIGFSDIARGGWRTVICTNPDEYITNTNTLFKEVFVLAHTQHLKNKDIYEGGSKLTAVLDAEEAGAEDEVTNLLYKFQFGLINAFLDIFVTEDGEAKNPNVVDYYAEDESIELGPDENMHDDMIEVIVQQSIKRGYLLGMGIMSSKRVGINHKEYGVTSRGVIKFAEIAMGELGVDMNRDPFSVKITGGTNGDVAGNCIRLLLERCPHAQILSIAAGAGGLYDPEGIDHKHLGKLVLKGDVVDFDAKALHPGGFILFRRERRKDGLRELHKKLVRTDSEINEHWITADEFYREFEDLVFSVSADLFLPCGGRPETIDENNYQSLFADDASPTARVICEGANSYITPEAREGLQRRGIVVLRDASANKCGVISSSYEIIANLLMTEKEFLLHKEEYVGDVLKILDKRAEEEAKLIFKRYHEYGGEAPYTEISDALSREINGHYARLFSLFQDQPEISNQSLFRKVILNHLPAFIRQTPKYRVRVKKLPPKIKYAILASEIASFIVYQGGWEVDFITRLTDYLKENLS